MEEDEADPRRIPQRRRRPAADPARAGSEPRPAGGPGRRIGHPAAMEGPKGHGIREGATDRGATGL